MQSQRPYGILAVTLAILLLLGACGGSGGPAVVTPPPPPRAAGYLQPDISICAASKVVSSGLLCAFQPSLVDAQSRDQYGTGSLADMRLGFGFHVVAFPPTGTDIQGVYVHLTGSYGRPYNQASAKFSTETFLEEALGENYIVLQIAYNNRFSVNIDECGGDVSRLNVDNCSGDVREEKITGMDTSSVNDTPLADSIEFRIARLVDYLQLQGFSFPQSFVVNGLVDWTQLRVGGHSQGATHALYLSKYFSAKSACLLAGGFDVADTIPTAPAEDLADWLLDNSVAVDIDSVRALVSVDDTSYAAFIRTYQHLQMIRDIHYVEFSDGPYADVGGNAVSGHGAVVFDPRYKDLRSDACFGVP